MRFHLLPLALALSAGLASAQTHNRFVDCVEFLPGSTSSQMGVRVTLGLQTVDTGAPADLTTTLHLFEGGTLLASQTVPAFKQPEGACATPCGVGGCWMDVNGVVTPGVCTNWSGFGCGCNVYINNIDWNDILPSVGGGTTPTITVVVESAPGSLPELDTTDDSTTVTFDGFFRCQPLSIDVIEVSISGGTSQSLAIDAGPVHSGRIYAVLGSRTGTSPGFPFGGLLVPLNIDSYFLFSLNNANGPIFSNTIGTLDGNGYATASFNMPPGAPPHLAGLQVDHACLVFAPGGVLGLVTNTTRWSSSPRWPRRRLARGPGDRPGRAAGAVGSRQSGSSTSAEPPGGLRRSSGCNAGVSRRM